MTDDDALIADLEHAAAVLGDIITAVPDRPLTAHELALLRAIVVQTGELRGAIAVLLAEGDSGEVVRRLLGPAPEARA